MDNYKHGDNRECNKDFIMSCGKGGFVDLSNTPTNGAVLARVSIDTSRLTNPMIKIDFSGMLSYRLTVLEELDLVFTLYRDDKKGEMTELASWPYKVLMDQTLTGAEEEEYIFTVLEKNETFNLSFCDELSCTHGGCYTYILKVESNYFNITNAFMQSGVMSAIAQSQCCQG